MALPFAVLISGRGSNLLALEQATRDGRIDGRITLVLSDRADAAGIPAASALGLATTVLEPRGMDRAAYGAALSAALEESGAELVALAGFMRILDVGFVRRWEGRLLNIHPSLLPAWRGLHTHRRVLEAGERAHGCTVHYVVEELDAGPIVIQGRLAVRPGEDEAGLSARVQRLEHIIYPRAVGWAAEGRLAWRDGAVFMDGAPLRPTVVGLYTGDYVHDSHVRRDRAYLSESNRGNLRIVDVLDPARPRTISVTPTPGRFTHNAWVTDDDALGEWAGLFRDPLGAFSASWTAISESYAALFTGAFGHPTEIASAIGSGDLDQIQSALAPISEMIVTTTPLILVGLSVARARRGEAGPSGAAMTHAWRAIGELRESGRSSEAAMAESFGHIAAGRPDAALETLRRLVDESPPGFAGWTIPIEPLLAELRETPEYQAVLKRLAERAT